MMDFFLAVYIVCVLCSIMAMKMSIEEKKEDAKMAEKEKTKLGGTALNRFFVECVLARCNDFSQEKNVEKSKMLAQKYSLEYPNGVKALYDEGFQEYLRITANRRAADLEIQKKVEAEMYQIVNHYSDKTGREKRIAILTDQRDRLRGDANKQQQEAAQLLRNTQQKEQDWAIWGGIADGLAGPIAGVATAVDVQRKNREIREQNKANLEAAMPEYMAITRDAARNQAHAAQIDREIELTKEKMVADAPAEEVFKKLSFITPEVDVSDTGAFHVTATIQVNEKLFIYGDVPAVIDGTIVACVYEEGKLVGTANMVLPVNGISDKTGAMGMGLSGANPTKEHTVEFVPGHLWMMEA